MPTSLAPESVAWQAGEVKKRSRFLVSGRTVSIGKEARKPIARAAFATSPAPVGSKNQARNPEREKKKKSGGLLRRSRFASASIPAVAGQSPALLSSPWPLLRASRITLAALDRHNKRVTVVPAIGIAGVTCHGRGVHDFGSLALHIHLDQMFNEATNR